MLSDFLTLEIYFGSENAAQYFEDLVKMIELLPNATREVFRLYAIEGFSHKEIASRLRLTESVVTNRLYRARKKIRPVLVSEGLIPH